MSRRDPISFAVVNFDGACVLPDTLASVLRAARTGDEVLVVDNASRDDSRRVVASYGPVVRLVPLSENRGPGAARNVAFRIARHDRILFLDVDVELEPGCAGALCRALRAAPDATFAAPTVVHADEPDVIQHAGASAHLLGLMSVEDADGRPGSLPPGPRSLGSLVSACFLVDRGRWGDEDLFDEDLFIYQEDHELGLRSRITGHEILGVPAAVCRHGSGTPGLSLRRSGRHHPVRIVNTIRNRWLLILSNYQLRTLVLLAPSLLVFEVLQLGGALRKGWTRHWLRALGHVVKNLPARLTRRRRIQSRRARGDGEVLTDGPCPFTPELLDHPVERWAARTLQGLATANWRAARRFL